MGRPFKQIVTVGVASLVSAALLTGCGFGSSAKTDSKSQSLTMEYGTFSTLDPAITDYGMWVDQSALMEGLTVPNNTGDGAQPGIADKWTVSTDGTVYTFHIRDGAKWSDGQPITAQDFVFSLKRGITPPASSETLPSFQPSIGIKGAAAYAAGTSKDFSAVGIQAVDPQTVKYTLSAPNPDFLVQLAYPSMLPVPEHVVSKYPKDWATPAHWVGDGPFVLKAWKQNASATLAKNPKYWDAGSVKLSTINLQLVPDGSESTLPYDNNEVSITPVPVASLTRYQTSQYADQLKVVKASGIAYLGLIPSKNTVLQNVQVRKAISLAMGRTELANVTPGTTPANQIVPSSTPGWNKSDGVTEDVTQAKALLAQAGHANGAGIPPIHILAASGNETIVSAIAQNLHKNLGLTVKPDIEEVGVYATKRFALQDANYVGFYYGQYAGTPTWHYWTTVWMTPRDISRLSLAPADYATYQSDQTKNPGAVPALLSAKGDSGAQKFASLVQQASQEPDTQKAIALYKQAALAREATYEYLPLLYANGYWLAKPNVQGFTPRLGFLLSAPMKNVSISK